MSPQDRVAVVAILVAAVLLAAFTEPGNGGHGAAPGERTAITQPVDPAAGAPDATHAPPAPSTGPDPDALTTGADAGAPRWHGERALPDRGLLVAYYGTPGSGALGVLGETSPRKAFRRLRRAARPFERPGRPVGLVFELIVTVADAHPGKGRDFSHDVRKRQVRRYVEVARELGVHLVLDLQPGRTGFLKVAKRWAWALEQPHVSLALDPEWRMGRRQVPGRVIGSVGAGEINRVAAWLGELVVRNDLPEKLLIVHQFRTSMVRHIDRVKAFDGLQLVQHVDGFGNRAQKLDTYRTVARPDIFAMGFKLFYDEDFNRMTARGVHRIRPRVRFVSFQ